MADKTTGPVKPPILDAKPREAKTAAAEPAPSVAKAETPGSAPAGDSSRPAEHQKPAASASEPLDAATPPARTPLLPLAAAGLGGAVLGVILSYLVASAGYWPNRDAAPGPSQDAFDALSARVSQLADAPALPENLETRLAALETANAQAPQPDSAIEQLSDRIAALENAAPAETETASLAARIEALEADSSAAQGIADRLAALEDAIIDRDEAAAIAGDRDRLAQLPAAIAGLESAMASGRPFASALAAAADLSAIAPTDAAIAAAATGVASDGALLAAFRALIPSLLAAGGPPPEAGWLETLGGQAAAALALRPAGGEGDDPASLVGRTETALEAGALDDAAALVAVYPAPMAAIAAPFAETLSARAAADAYLQALRGGPGAPVPENTQ